MSFELPTELIDKIMEEAKEPIHKKLLKLDLFDLTCLKLELNRIYDNKCIKKKEELRKYKNCIVNINDKLYLMKYLNKRDMCCMAVVEVNGENNYVFDGLDLSNFSFYSREDKKNNKKYRIIYDYSFYIKYEDIKKIELVYDLPLYAFNWNRGVID